MKAISRIIAVGALMGVAGCSSLPEAGLGGTFLVEPFMKASIGGDGFAQALAREYQAQASQAATKDVNWYDASAYMRRGYAAMNGENVMPWDPALLGLSGEANTVYQAVLASVAGNRDKNPMACAKAQALYDNWVEELSEGDHSCSDPAAVRKELDDALAACGKVMAVEQPEAPKTEYVEKVVEKIVERPVEVVREVEKVVYVDRPVEVAPAPVYVEPTVQPVAPSYPSRYTIYFGHNRADLTAEANSVVDEIVNALYGYASPLLNIIGHTDTSGSKAYNQRLAEKRANAVANALSARGVARESMRVSARSELAPAVSTGDSVREALNRRVEIEIVQ